MIQLVPFVEEDRWQVLEWRNDPSVASYMYTTEPISREVHNRWFSQQLEGGDRKGWIVRMDGKGVGAAFVSQIDYSNSRASWAFYLADSTTRGRGVGTAVEFLVLDHVFGELELHKLCCEVLSFNQPVVTMHKKFGFVEEGLLVQHYRRSGDWIDVHVLALFQETWAERREDFGHTLRRRNLIP